MIVQLDCYDLFSDLDYVKHLYLGGGGVGGRVAIISLIG